MVDELLSGLASSAPSDDIYRLSCVPLSGVSRLNLSSGCALPPGGTSLLNTCWVHTALPEDSGNGIEVLLSSVWGAMQVGRHKLQDNIISREQNGNKHWKCKSGPG